jgi:hypothetical protein
MIPPEFSASEYSNNSKLLDPSSIISFLGNIGLMPQNVSTLEGFSKVIPFMATDFTPPQTQIQNAQVQSRTGALSYAADVHETETVTVSYVESNPLTIYKFHLLWTEYIRDILKGSIEPNSKYLDSNSEYFGAQDYLASFYIVKYIPDMKTISYIGKCIGVYPLALPSKELIGTRNTNEICILPFEYSCIAYREWIDGLSINSWIKEELERVQLIYGSSLF